MSSFKVGATKSLALLLCAAASLSGCATPSSSDSGATQAGPAVASGGPADRGDEVVGYHCTIGRAFERGVYVSVDLDRSGRQTRASWDLRISPQTLLRVNASGSVTGPTRLGAEQGYGSIQWALPGANRPGLERLELTSAPENLLWSFAPFAGEWERTGDHSLMATWADMRTFARGASTLFVILRDRKGGMLNRAEIDPAAISQGAAEVQSALDRVATMASDYRRQCDPVHRRDVIEGDIIVT